MLAADDVGRDDVPAVPGAAERGPSQAGRQHGALPPAALLHARSDTEGECAASSFPTSYQ
jgi:hypothetical protein